MSEAENVAIISVIGVLGAALVTGLFSYFRAVVTEKKRLQSTLDQALLEMRFQRAALSFPEFVEEWKEINNDIILLMKETRVDSFLIMRAWNGHLEPRWTTAFFQLRQDGQQYYNYVHFELDNDYVARLREITQNNNAYLVTKELPKNSVLFYMHDMENIAASYIAHLATHDGPIKGTKSQTYCSFSTHQESGMTEHTKTRCRILANRMKGLAAGFEEKPI